MKIHALAWKTCWKCEAPQIRPLPEHWSYTVRKRRTGICHVTPHLPECPSGFKKVELPDGDE